MVVQTPLGRFGRPADIAPVAVFLASDDSAWLTGEVLVASAATGSLDRKGTAPRGKTRAIVIAPAAT